MNRRILLPVFAVGAVIIAMAASSAQAGLFGQPACCEPACCEPAACEPACCEPACDTCCPPRCGLLQRLRARMSCAPSCCEPAACEPACCEPAAC